MYVSGNILYAKVWYGNTVKKSDAINIEKQILK